MKRGQLRDDGMVFWAKDPSMRNGERWVSQEKFNELKKKHTEREVSRYRTCERTKRLAKARAKKWKQIHPELAKAANRKWVVENPEKVSATWGRRRERVKSFQITERQRDMIREIYRARKRVSECTGIEFHVDHIIPLAMNGRHMPENLQLLPAKINQSKGARPGYWFGHRSEEKFRVQAAFGRKS